MSTHGEAVEAVVFDYGGVLTGPLRGTIAAWMEADGVVPSSFTRTLKDWHGGAASDDSPICLLERGEITPQQFELLMAERLTTVDGKPIQPAGLLRRLFAELRPDDEMFALAIELRDLGLAVGLLSNSWGNGYPTERINGLFDPVVISGDVGLRKPLAPIYELALRRLGLPASRVLFVDDLRENVRGAQAVGMQALLHADPQTTRAALADLVPGLAPVRILQPQE